MAQAFDGVGSYLANATDERQRAWHEAQEIVERCRRESRQMNADEETKYERIAGAGGVLDQLGELVRTYTETLRVDRENDQYRAEFVGVAQPASGGRVSRRDDDLDAFLRGTSPGNIDRKTFEIDLGPVVRARQLIRAGATGAEFRTNLNVGTAGAGKNLVPTGFVNRLFDYMEQASGVRRTNVTILNTNGGEPLQVPTSTAHGTAAIVGEGSALAEADPAFGQVTLGSWKYGQLCQVTNELLSDSGVDVLGWLARDFGRGLGRATGAAYVHGVGSASPTGVAYRAGTATTIQTGATGLPSYANLVDTIYSVIEEYRVERGAVVDGRRVRGLDP